MSVFESLDGERIYFTNELEQRRLCLELTDPGATAGAVQIRVVSNTESFFRVREIAYRLTLEEARKARDYLVAAVGSLEAKSAGSPSKTD